MGGEVLPLLCWGFSLSCLWRAGERRLVWDLGHLPGWLLLWGHRGWEAVLAGLCAPLQGVSAQEGGFSNSST